MLSALTPERRTVLAQLTRFVVGGAFVTLLGLGAYALIALVLRWHPQLANFLAYLVAMVTGYVTHSQWSFRGHGADRTHGTRFKFVVVSLISLGLNSFWVWLCFSQLQLGRAAPMVPMLFVTPAVTFLLNRQWVFR